MTEPDTIVAISTAPGAGAIGIVRVSGPATQLIHSVITGNSPRPRQAQYSIFKNRQQRVVDRGIALFFPGPESYTGEDLLELHAHGNRLVLEQLVDCVLQCGARRARPGEFTERAFLNNKIDLIQAEAVADLINANNLTAVKSAARSLQGEFSKLVYGLCDRIISIRTRLEAELDFSEEEIRKTTDTQLITQLKALLEEIEKLLERSRQGQRLQQGIDVVIMGKPNVGKSTLLNRLAAKEAAIVTDTAGTTRDLIEVDILLNDMPVRITDTAGLRHADGEIEQEGIRRARLRSENADLILFVREPQQDLDQEERAFIDNIKPDQQLIQVYNKIDRYHMQPEINDRAGKDVSAFISAKTGAGLDLLIESIKQVFRLGEMGEDLVLARKRHITALESCRDAISRAIDGYLQHKATELVAEDMKFAHQTLDEITGVFSADDLLGKIFSEFCIGK